MHAGEGDVSSRTVCLIQSIPGVTTVLAGLEMGNLSRCFFLSSFLAFISVPLCADTREGHKCCRVLLLRMG